MVSERSGPHDYSAPRFGVLRRAPKRGRAKRQIRAGGEVSGARMSTPGAPGLFGFGSPGTNAFYRIWSWLLFYSPTQVIDHIFKCKRMVKELNTKLYYTT